MNRYLVWASVTIITLATMVGIVYLASRLVVRSDAPSVQKVVVPSQWQTAVSRGSTSYSFEYPSNWRVRETERVTRVTFSSEVYVDIIRAKEITYIDEIPETGPSFTRATEYNGIQKETEAGRVRFVKQDMLTVNDSPARLLVWCRLPTQNGLLLETCQTSTDIAYKTGTFTFTLVVRNSTSETNRISAESYQTIYSHIVNSFGPITESALKELE